MKLVMNEFAEEETQYSISIVDLDISSTIFCLITADAQFSPSMFFSLEFDPLFLTDQFFQGGLKFVMVYSQTQSFFTFQVFVIVVIYLLILPYLLSF